MSSSGFNSLGLRDALISSIDALGYANQTDVQRLTLPVLLKNHDVIAQAQTGSGKTAAFAIGLLQKIQEKKFNTQALVVCPTRELADQVADEIRSLAKAIGNLKVLVLCGGKPVGVQLASLKQEPHIVVGTPGRLLQHLTKKSLKLFSLETLVLDEADRMLDMGFIEDIEKIISFTPASRQTLLFSATFSEAIKSLGASYQRDAQFIQVESGLKVDEIEQLYFEVGLAKRAQFVQGLLAHYKPESCLVFCNTIERCQSLAEELRAKGIHGAALHGDLEQFKRDQVLTLFANKSSSVLIATDVAARGLDIKDLELVVNFELPRDPEVFVHRIGRTGRAGKKGLAIGLYDASERRAKSAIEELVEIKIEPSNPSILNKKSKEVYLPQMISYLIQGGRRDKLRPGDIVGVLTKQQQVAGAEIGKIDVLATVSYVAINRESDHSVLTELSSLVVKGKKFKLRRLK